MTQDKPGELKKKPDAGSAGGAVNIWKEGYNIRWYEIDAGGRLSLPSLCNFLQDAATRHADQRGVALNRQQDTNMTWVLSRLLVRMETWPGFKEPIFVETWPSGTDRMFALRDFRITDETGRVIGVSTSAWLVIDAHTRRIIRVDRAFTDRIRNVTSLRALDKKLVKLPELRRPEGEKRFSVRYNDLDTNQHANNVVYIEWAMESVAGQTLGHLILSEFEINFQAEAVFGEEVIAFCEPINDRRTEYRHKIISGRDSRELVRAGSVWKTPAG